MASEREVYHVVPDREDYWKVEREGVEIPLTISDRKQDAIAAGRRVAQAARVGQLIIHRADGSVEVEFTYRKNPR